MNDVRKAIKSVLDGIRKQYGKEAAVTLADGGLSTVREVVPTGISLIDHDLIGIGGVPIGRLTEISGEVSAGKSTLLAHLVASVQAEGGLACLWDTETAFEPGRISALGGAPDDVVLGQGETIEDVVAQIGLAIARSSDVAPDIPLLIGWDSLAATPTKKELDGVFDDSEGDSEDEKRKKRGDGMGYRARVMSTFCRAITREVAKKRVALVIVNQLRDKPGVMFGEKTTTPGGQAVKYHAHLRIQMTRGAQTKETGEEFSVGHSTHIRIAKNRCAAPFRRGDVLLRFDGDAPIIDEAATLIDHARQHGLCTVSRGLVTVKATGLTCITSAPTPEVLTQLRAASWPNKFNAPAVVPEDVR